MSSAIENLLWVAVAAAIFLFVMPYLRKKVMGGAAIRKQQRFDNLELSGIEPSKIVQLGKELASRLAEDAKKAPKHEVEITRHALWMAMLVEAGADDDIDEREVEFVSTLYGRLIAKQPGHSHIASAGDDILGNREGAFTEIAKARDVSLQSKQNILWGAFLVSISNYAMEPSEAKCLNEIADALSLGVDDRREIFNVMSQSVSSSQQAPT
ncbi:MAG: hypothetical protein ACR2O0_15740 [Rhizobiaceae bacterium]